MLKKHPKAGRLVRLPSKIVVIMDFKDGHFLVRNGSKKIEKITEETMMIHGTLIPKECCEEKKLAPKQDYVNQEFKRFFEQRDRRDYEEKILKGFVIEDETIEEFTAEPS